MTSPQSSTETASTVQSGASSPSSPGTKLRNGLIAIAAIILSVALFLGINNPSGTNTLAALAESSVPLNVAQANGKPTLMEFYADWCTSCQAMAGDLGELKQSYGDRLNFVMLNVDNTKWLPELTEYRVDGIPHFVFLTEAGDPIASVIGEQPRTIMAANLDALATGQPLPYLGNQGQSSVFEAPSRDVSSQKAVQVDRTDPRSHGG